MKQDDEPVVSSEKKLFVLLCEDMDAYSIPFVNNRPAHFRVGVCSDIRCLLAELDNYEKHRDLPDVLLLDVFSKLDNIDDDASFRQERQTIDSEVKTICEMIAETNKKARLILAPYGIHFLKSIREKYSECRLPIMLYSRLGPYILTGPEAHDVDLYNAQFLLKYLDYHYQYLLIENFYSKWRSPQHPIPLEISRKLSTLPRPLADGVVRHLNKGLFDDAIKKGFLILTHYLQNRFGCTLEGRDLTLRMIDRLLIHGRRRAGENEDRFKRRVQAACWLYHNVYVLRRSPPTHVLMPDIWREIDMSLSSYNMIWREIEELLG